MAVEITTDKFVHVTILVAIFCFLFVAENLEELPKQKPVNDVMQANIAVIQKYITIATVEKIRNKICK